MPDWKSYVRERLDLRGVEASHAEEVVEEVAQQMEDAYQDAIKRGAGEDSARTTAENHITDWNAFSRDIHRTQSEASVAISERMERLASTSPGFQFLILEFLRNILYASRSLRKNYRFTAIVIFTITLGIGATTAIFSIINGLILQPLPYPDSDRITWAWGKFSQGDRAAVSPPDFQDYRSRTKSFENLAAMHIMHQWVPFVLNMQGQGSAIRLNGAIVTAGFFEVFGAKPLLGRTFTSVDEKEGSYTAILSHQAWQSHFQSDAQVVGKLLRLNGESYTVVGVAPENFRYPLTTEVWIPFTFGSPGTLERSFHFLRPIGLRRAESSLQQAQTEMSTIAKQLEREYPQSNRTWTVTLVGLQEQMISDVRKPVLIIFSAVCFLLLIACANVANLLLARANVRQKEMAIRVALGAGRSRILLQMLAESVVLTLPAAILGVLISHWSVQALKSAAPAFLPRLEEVSTDASTLVFTLACSALTVLLVSFAPVWNSMPPTFAQRLKETKYQTKESNRLRNGLVVAEIALSLILLAGAGLLLKSFWKLINVDLGFNKSNLLTIGVALEGERFEKTEFCATFVNNAMERLRNLPGVQGVAAGTGLPLVAAGGDRFFGIQGRAIPDNDAAKPNAQFRIVTKDFFSTFQIPILMGRSFSSADNARSAPVVIINDALARKFFPGENPVGRVVLIDEAPPVQATIIGVSGNSRQELIYDAMPEMYVPFNQEPTQYFHIAVRTGSERTGQAMAIKSTLQQLDPNLTFPEVRSMDEIIGEGSMRRRLQAGLLAAAAGVALLLSAVGIYGVLSFSVEQRKQEIGVRMALGAQPKSILRMILVHGLKLSLFGLLLGLSGALILTRVMASVLFEVSPWDPLIFATVAFLMLLVSIIACWAPATRATRVDPLRTLRYE